MPQPNFARRDCRACIADNSSAENSSDQRTAGSFLPQACQSQSQRFLSPRSEIQCEPVPAILAACSEAIATTQNILTRTLFKLRDAFYFQGQTGRKVNDTKVTVMALNPTLGYHIGHLFHFFQSTGTSIFWLFAISGGLQVQMFSVMHLPPRKGQFSASPWQRHGTARPPQKTPCKSISICRLYTEDSVIMGRPCRACGFIWNRTHGVAVGF